MLDKHAGQSKNLGEIERGVGRRRLNPIAGKIDAALPISQFVIGIRACRRIRMSGLLVNQAQSFQKRVR